MKRIRAFKAAIVVHVSELRWAATGLTWALLFPLHYSDFDITDGNR